MKYKKGDECFIIVPPVFYFLTYGSPFWLFIRVKIKICNRKEKGTYIVESSSGKITKASDKVLCRHPLEIMYAMTIL